MMDIYVISQIRVLFLTPLHGSHDGVSIQHLLDLVGVILDRQHELPWFLVLERIAVGVVGYPVLLASQNNHGVRVGVIRYELLLVLNVPPNHTYLPDRIGSGLFHRDFNVLRSSSLQRQLADWGIFPFEFRNAVLAP